ncbi:outer membrane protein [Vibrio coralliilyticus]|uniref:outer membrane protein n=1 Tax=Vibrio coralliilyticus TaxID=190893 RepID=UPI002409BC08|nr:outer membrane beta-barrel protein [Vibrio coralliilyticus]WFB46533.1 outer membrane beta-barrel protein [Vibrio coralliilyticus]
MKKSLLLIGMSVCAPLSVNAASSGNYSIYFGMSYDHSHVNLNHYGENMDGLHAQAGTDMENFGIKGSATSLSNHGEELDNYSFAVDKKFALLDQKAYIAPEAGVNYARYNSDLLKVTDFGPEAGINLGYNINKNFAIETSYRHSFGLTNNDINIDQDSVNLGLNYRFD